MLCQHPKVVKSLPILYSQKTTPVWGMFVLKEGKPELREPKGPGEQAWCWIFVPQTLWLPLVPGPPSTDMQFPDFNILKKCIEVFTCARFSTPEGSEASQRHRCVYN